MSNQIKKGLVVSRKTDKTATVAVEQIKTHLLYKKKFTVTKRYKVHDEENQTIVGDFVEIVSTKPLSREKHFKVSRKIESLR